MGLITFITRKRDLWLKKVVEEAIKDPTNISLHEAIGDALHKVVSIRDAIHLGTLGSASLELKCRAGNIYHEHLTTFKALTGGTEIDWWEMLKRHYGKALPTLPTIKRYIYLFRYHAIIREGITKCEITTMKSAEQYITRRTGTTKRKMR